MRVNQRVINRKEERCAVCRDGPDGLVVCRGCNTFLHASCLIDVRGCPTLGCTERDPLEAQQADCAHDTYNVVDRSCADCGMSYKQMERGRQLTPSRTSSECWVHSKTVTPEAKADLFALHRWSVDAIAAQCVCDNAKGVNLKEHRAIRRAESGPQKEPICKHEITLWDQECVFCRRTIADIDNEERAKECASYTKPFLTGSRMVAVPSTIGGVPSTIDGIHSKVPGQIQAATDDAKSILFWTLMIAPPLIVGLLKFIGV